MRTGKFCVLYDGLDQSSEQLTQMYSKQTPKGLYAPRLHVRIFEQWYPTANGRGARQSDAAQPGSIYKAASAHLFRRHQPCEFREHATSAPAELGGEIHNVSRNRARTQVLLQARKLHVYGSGTFGAFWPIYTQPPDPGSRSSWSQRMAFWPKVASDFTPQSHRNGLRREQGP